MKINFYLRDKTSKVETPIEFVIQFGFSTVDETGKKLYKKIKRSTGNSIKPKYWNEKTQRVRESYEKNTEINLRLDEIMNFLNSVEKEFHEKSKVLTIELLKEKLDIFFKGDKSKPQEYNLITFAEYVLENKEHKQHKRILNQTLRVLKEFSEATKYRIDFDTINIDFYDLFISYLNQRQYAKNTKAKHISNLKYFMNEALLRKLHSNFDFKSTKFKAEKESVKNIYLNDSEIEILYNLDLSLNPRLEKVRDLFLIGCYTGLRFSDFTQINSTNINENILSIKTQKTGTDVKIPLRPEAIAIFNKYNGTIPKPTSNQKMNDYLKEIAEKAGFTETILKYKSKGNATVKETKYKYELVCTHTARRSFATNCYNAKIPSAQIMLITGHKTESEFFKYIQIDKDENAKNLLNNEYFMPKMKVC